MKTTRWAWAIAGLAMLGAGCASGPQARHGCAEPNYGGAVIGSQAGCE